MSLAEPQVVQALAVAAVLTAFALAEMLQGRFFAREATAQDNRLDIAVTLMFPVISLGVLAITNALCEWLLPQYRAALAHWPWWQMLLVLLAWLVERTISTPATHFAHHALVQDDGIGHYTGNYGNLLFIWDVVFGTARFSRRYPPAYGLADDRRHGPERWLAQLVFPLVRSKRADSVLGAGRHTPPP